MSRHSSALIFIVFLSIFLYNYSTVDGQQSSTAPERQLRVNIIPWHNLMRRLCSNTDFCPPCTVCATCPSCSRCETCVTCPAVTQCPVEKPAITHPLTHAGSSSQLGPFFGYFPYMFAKPCPTCPRAKSDSITACSGTSSLTQGVSSNPKGSINVTNSGGRNSCLFLIGVRLPNTKIWFRCTAIAGALSLDPAPTQTPVGTLYKINTLYVITTDLLTVSFTFDATNTPISAAFSCSWRMTP